MHISFLALFEIEIRSNLLVGRVFDKGGNVIPDFMTFLGRKPLQVRGGPESTRRTCECCGRFMYYPLGDSYVVRTTLTGQQIYEASNDIAISNDLARRIPRAMRKGVYIVDLPVRDEARDGVVEFPDNYF